MATVKTPTKKSPAKKKAVDAQMIITAYMNYVLDHGEQPKTIYKFCKDLKIEESEFYKFFGSFENLKSGIWSAFHTNTINVLHKDSDFENYPNKDKMLSYFFTMFEMLTANRSYVLFSLGEQKHMLKNMTQLKDLRAHLKVFTANLIEAGNDEKNYKVTKNPVRLFSEGAWVQFLFLLKYWMDDSSAAFEKTDVAIEKSVKAIFDIFETTPLESIIDFGKFLFKENFANSK